MPNEASTINSLKAVDAWIDVINANINGGVRTAFKSSRLKFAGSNVNVLRSGNSTSLPLQMPEPGLTTANTIIDFSQGAITTSTESTHVAIQGSGWFKLKRFADLNSPTTDYLYTRDGEFRWMTLPAGVSVQTSGSIYSGGGFTVQVLVNHDGLAVMSDWVGGSSVIHMLTDAAGAVVGGSGSAAALGAAYATRFVEDMAARNVPNQQGLLYSQYGSTVMHKPTGTVYVDAMNTSTILAKSLEASNASMTQSVPELSLAQKLFSALTKVLQITQTNTD
ncbi:MAG: hypothetical protein H7338_06760, partial [Candidatus Sericytochromatia bacterium]|nr:hypothetical protein [Candidatus Sericytochromatia bacterium]